MLTSDIIWPWECSPCNYRCLCQLMLPLLRLHATQQVGTEAKRTSQREPHAAVSQTDPECGVSIYLSCLLQKVVLDHVMDIDGCSGDVWGPYSSKAREVFLQRRKERIEKQKADKVRSTAICIVWGYYFRDVCCATCTFLC